MSKQYVKFFFTNSRTNNYGRHKNIEDRIIDFYIRYKDIIS